MQIESADTVPTTGSGAVSPVDPTLLTPWNTIRRPPPELGPIMAMLRRVIGQNGVANKVTLVREFMRLKKEDRKVYTEQGAKDLFEFFVAYGVLYQQPNQTWHMDDQRLQEVTIACDNCKPLAHNFVVTTIPGEACGCPQTANARPPAKEAEGSAAKPTASVDQPKPFVVQRVAFMTASCIRTLEAINVCQEDTVVGEVRSPVHMSDEAFLASDIGKYFGGERDLFAVELYRLVEAGIVEVRKGTGPGGVYDALVLPVPFKSLHITPITERKAIALPGHVLDVVNRVLALEGLTIKKGSLHSTIRATVSARIRNKGVAKETDKLADRLVDRMLRYNPAEPEKGWGLVTAGRNGVDAEICYPGLGPVEFVENGDIMRDIPVNEVVSSPKPELPSSAPPRFIAVSDVGESTSEADLDRILADGEAILAAARAEKDRRVEAARVAAELAVKAARRAELEAQLIEQRALAARKAEEARQAEEARVALEQQLAAL